MFRPQFSYPIPPSPCFDQKCQYSFDQTNMPVFTGSLAAGQQTTRLPLHVDKDAAFLLRAASTIGAVAFRLELPSRDPLSDSENSNQGSNFELPNEYSNTGGANYAILEAGNGGMHIPAGGSMYVYLYNPTSGSINLTTCAINLHGEKRYPGEKCS